MARGHDNPIHGSALLSRWFKSDSDQFPPVGHTTLVVKDQGIPPKKCPKESGLGIIVNLCPENFSSFLEVFGVFLLICILPWFCVPTRGFVYLCTY